MSTVIQQENQQQNPQSDQQQAPKKRGKKGLTIFVTLVLLASIAAAGFFGFKYFETEDRLRIVSTELGKYQLAILPDIEKNTSITTTDEYYAFVTEGSFVSKYKLQLNPDVNLNFRDFTTSTVSTAGEYGSTFPIAYVEKSSTGKHAGKYCVYFAIPYHDVITDAMTTRIVYVSLEDISAKLPSAATGAFVKAS